MSHDEGQALIGISLRGREWNNRNLGGSSLWSPAFSVETVTNPNTVGVRNPCEEESVR